MLLNTLCIAVMRLLQASRNTQHAKRRGETADAVKLSSLYLLQYSITAMVATYQYKLQRFHDQLDDLIIELWTLRR